MQIGYTINMFTLKFSSEQVENEWHHFEIGRKRYLLTYSIVFLGIYSVLNETLIMEDYFFMSDPVVLILRVITFLAAFTCAYYAFFWKKAYFEEQLAKKNKALDMIDK